MYQVDLHRPPKETLPTMYDLKSEDPEEPGLPDEFHLWQPRVLDETFRPPAYPRDEVFTASDLNLYFDARHIQWYKRPDWFAVVGVSRFYDNCDLRLSYVVWQEGVSPLIAIELLSPGTEKEDLGQTLRTVDRPPTKWQVYEQILRVPYYVVFDRHTNQLCVFALQGDRYLKQPLDESRIWIPSLELGLGLWEGVYRGLERLWLRWYDANGTWVLNRDEQADREHQRAERLAYRLRELGIDPEGV